MDIDIAADPEEFLECFLLWALYGDGWYSEEGAMLPSTKNQHNRDFTILGKFGYLCLPAAL